MKSNLISDNPVAHKFQLLTALSLVSDTQFHCKIIAILKKVFLLLCSHNFYNISTAGCATHLYDASEEINTRTVIIYININIKFIY